MIQFVDSHTCLECRGCCNFTHAQWLPVLLSGDMVRIGKKKIASRRGNGRILCEFLDTATHACTIYEMRPFECCLYPFMLIRKGRAIDLAAHLACPFVIRTMHTEPWKVYTRYLAGLFQTPEWLALLEKNIACFRNYPDEEFLTVQPKVLGPSFQGDV